MQRHICNFYLGSAFLPDSSTVLSMAKPFAVIQKQRVFQRASIDPTHFCMLREKNKTAVYDPLIHFIRLRWKLPDSFSHCPCREGRPNGQSNIPFSKAMASRWCPEHQEDTCTAHSRETGSPLVELELHLTCEVHITCTSHSPL